MVPLVLESQLERLSEKRRREAVIETNRLVEENGFAREEALEHLLMDQQASDAPPLTPTFRRLGLRWDE